MNLKISIVSRFNRRRKKCFSLTLILLSLLNHTSIRSLSVSRSLIILRAFFFSLSLSLSFAFSDSRIDYIMQLIALNMYVYAHPSLFISVSQPYDVWSSIKYQYVEYYQKITLNLTNRLSKRHYMNSNKVVL